MVKVVSRLGSDSKKWQKYEGKDILPLWIADSDFAVAEEILEAARRRLEHPVLGYPYHEEGFLRSVVDHCRRSYDWEIDARWIVPIPGCVPGLNFARGVSRMRGKRAGVVVSPNYPPFFSQSELLHDFYHLRVPALYDPSGWRLDFERIDQASSDDEAGILLLCHPHNPLGKVNTREELEAYADIAMRHDLIVCSDEIHCDLVLNGSKHIPFASLSEDALRRTITLMSPSKTWNIAGMCASFAIIADERLRMDFLRAARGLNDVNVLGRVMAQAAYDLGESWRMAQIALLKSHAKKIECRVNALDGVQVTPIDATYLAFIDCRDLGLANAQRYFEKHGLGFADGADYGMANFVRFNFACSEEILEEALLRFERAVRAL